MRYYILTTPTGHEVARLSKGIASYFDVTSDRWIADPLLAMDVRMNDDWLEVEANELPPGLVALAGKALRDRKSRTLRRGRHSRG